MSNQNSYTQNQYQVQLFDSLSKIDPIQWNSIKKEVPFCQTHEFLWAIEELHPNLEFRYVLLTENNTIKAAVYVQLLDFSFKNLVNYGTQKNNGIKNNIKKFIAKKDTKLLNLGNVFFTGDKGIISNQDEDIISLLPDLFNQIQKSFTQKKPTATLIANIYLEEEATCTQFCNRSFHPFITEPDMYLTLQNQWHSFDDYLQALSSKYRIRAKKVLSTSRDISTHEFSLDDLIKNKEKLNGLYNNVVNHVAFNMATLNVDFFEKIKQQYTDNCNILGYFLADELVGFACIFCKDISTMHVHYIGLNYEINKSHKLYNRMLLDFVKFGIEKQRQIIHFGRTATEIKTTIGAHPKELKAYLKMNNRITNTALPYFLKKIKPTEYIVRNPFKEEH